MVRTQLLATTSPEQTLPVGLAFGTIIGVNYPSYAVPGEVIAVGVLVENTGDTGSNMNVNFWWVNADLYGGVYNQDCGWSDEGDQYLGPGESKWFTRTTLFTMPAGDAWMKARSFLTGFMWSEWCDDYDFTVEQLIQAATALTLTFTPAGVPRGGPVTCAGRLTRTDTNAGVDGQTVAIQLYIGAAWVNQVTGATASGGNYSLTFNAPATAGSYRMRASYGGSAVLGLAPSVSEEGGLPVGVGPGYTPLIVTGVGLGLGLALLVAASRR